MIAGHVPGQGFAFNLDLIEQLDVKGMPNLARSNFITLTNALYDARRALRATLYLTNVYIVGGSNVIEKIDTRIDSVSIWGTRD